MFPNSYFIWKKPPFNTKLVVTKIKDSQTKVSNSRCATYVRKTNQIFLLDYSSKFRKTRFQNNRNQNQKSYFQRERIGFFSNPNLILTPKEINSNFCYLSWTKLGQLPLSNFYCNTTIKKCICLIDIYFRLMLNVK